MVGDLLLRGMIVGLLAGLVAFGFARIVGEPEVDRAIGFEEAMPASEGAGHHHEVEPVSRATQAGLGLFTGVVIYGTAMGGLLALVFAWVQGRFSRLDPRATAALLALGAFVAIVLVPGFKYPANPPSVGSGDTIGYRTRLFFLLLAVSIVGLALAAGLARRLWAGHGAMECADLRGGRVYSGDGAGDAGAARRQRGARGVPG